jgi:CubicO group peptidase (beta-lactamase class C family)
VIEPNPDEVGLSVPGLQRARDYVVTCVERGEIAGAVVVVSRRDQVALLASVGLRDIEAGTPMEPDTIFRIASMTKPIVSVGTLMLVEGGKLQLDDPVSRYVPELADVEVFAGVENGHAMLEALERPITIYDLLTHTSGLSTMEPHADYKAAYETVFDSFGSSQQSLAEVIRHLAALPLSHQPGRAWTYGWSHDVLGRVIEVVSEQPLDDYLEQHILAPLAMVDTGFYVPPNKVERLAVVYDSVDGELQPSNTWYPNRFTERLPLLSGGGGLVSTAPDFLLFSRMLLRRGELDGVRLLDPVTVELMTRNHLTGALDQIRIGDDGGMGFGLGVAVRVKLVAPALAGRVGTYEWGGRWTTFFWIDPLSQLICIVMTQLEPVANLPFDTRFRSLVYEALTPRQVG